MTAVRELICVHAGGRAGAELRGFALPELLAALEAHGLAPPLASRTDASQTSVLSFPTGHRAAEAVARCALTTLALEALADGTPGQIAGALVAAGEPLDGLAVRPLEVSGRSRPAHRALEQAAQDLWDTGFNRTSPRTPAAYVLPRGLLARVVAFGGTNARAWQCAASPAGMPPTHGVLTANLARVRPGSLVLDPCAGAGSLLAAALDLGASAVIALDRSVAVDRHWMARQWPGAHIEAANSDVTAPGFRARPAVDAVVTDLPYGHLCELDSDLIQSALLFSYECLLPGCYAAVWAHQDLSAAASKIGFEIMAVMRESRKTGVERVMNVLRKPGSMWTGGARGAGSDRQCVIRRHGRGGAGRAMDEWLYSCSMVRDMPYNRSKSLVSDCWRAAWKGDVRAVEACLEAGIQIGAPDGINQTGLTMLQYAASYGKLGVVRLLLAKKAVVDDEIVARARKHGHTEVVTLLTALDNVDDT